MMQPFQDIREVPELSPDPRVRIFRRVLRGWEDFDGMAVDAYVVLGESHAVILDTLLCPADMAYVMARIEPELGNRQLLCVNSHADWDHTWGNGFFNSPRHVPILAHEECRRRLLSLEARLELNEYKTKTPLFAGVTLVPPTLTFREQLVIADERLSIELWHAPGHCRDHIVAWLPALRLLLAFDALEKPFPSIEDSTCVPLMFSTLERLAALDAQTILCSHGNATGPTLLQENLTYLRTIEDRARRFLAQHTLIPTELEQASTLLDYPFAEALAQAQMGEEIDHTYYSWVHEHNAQAILSYLHEHL